MPLAELRPEPYNYAMQLLSDVRLAQPQATELLCEARAQGRLHHAYIITSPAGTPQQPLVDAFCQLLVCANPGDNAACGTCAPCRKFAGGNHPDVHELHPNDKNVIPIDAVRNLTARLGLRASESPVKLARIHEADRLNHAAQNALLKTLEEPPGATVFFLMARRISALLPTIRSRCQRLRLAPHPTTQTLQHLQEAGIDAELAPCLAAILGDDIAAAQSWQDAGAADIWHGLRNTLAAKEPVNEIFRLAADLGGDRQRFDMALALLELLVHASLAQHYGAPQGLLPALPVDCVHAGRAVDALQRLRLQQALHINRAMALEGVLFTLAGLRQPTVAA